MKSLLNILDPELVFWQLEALTDTEAIGWLADQLTYKGIVKESFKASVIAREQAAPTGLQTERIGIALPHTGEAYVNRKGLAIGFLKSPVLFRAMGMPDQEVSTEIIFMPSLTDPHGHIDILQELAAVFEKSEYLVQMKNAGDTGRLIELISSLR